MDAGGESGAQLCRQENGMIGEFVKVSALLCLEPPGRRILDKDHGRKVGAPRARRPSLNHSCGIWPSDGFVALRMAVFAALTGWISIQPGRSKAVASTE